jgi:hypothetical protein
MTWDTLPKFLLCDDHAGMKEDGCFVLHTPTPRFLMEFVPGGEGEFRLIDPPTDDLAAIKEQAREFFNDGTIHSGPS